MPVLELGCQDCGHEFRSLVMAGTKIPEVWVCSACGSRRARPRRQVVQPDHPFEGGPGRRGCRCCG